MDIEEFKPPAIDFSFYIRKELFEENGPYCLFCGKQILEASSLKPLMGKIATIHHIVFQSAGGLGVKNNGLVCCRNCHDDIHKFMDCFSISKNDYDFYTTVYIWLFTEQVLDDSVYERFNYLKYAENLRDLTRQFKKKLKKQTADSRLLATYYIYYSNNYVDDLVKDFVSSSFSKTKLELYINKILKDDFIKYGIGLLLFD